MASRYEADREHRENNARLINHGRTPGDGPSCAGEQKQSFAGNGPQDGFATGATRSTAADKIDYEGHINPEVLAIYGNYMHQHRVQRDGQLRASDNWQQGIPVYRYMKSLVRHHTELWRMWRGNPVINPDSEQFFTFRDVLCAILFNVMGMLYEMDKQAHLLNLHSLERWRREDLERDGAPKNDVPVPDPRVQNCYPGCCEHPPDGCSGQANPPESDVFNSRSIPGADLRALGIHHEGTYRFVIERDRS